MPRTHTFFGARSRWRKFCTVTAMQRRISASGTWDCPPEIGTNRPPDAHGFDYWFATGNNAQPSHRDPVNFIRNGEPVGRIEGYACQIVVDEAITWLDESRDSDVPFFLNVWFHEPHAPIAAPDDIVTGYGQCE